jgi:hypothetical protein
MSPILGTLASQFSGKPFSSFESIATFTGSASTTTFSSIASSYKHLQLRINYLEPNGGQSLSMRFNGDTGGNYVYHALEGTGSTAIAYGYTGQSNMSIFSGNNNGTVLTYPNVMIVDIIDYASTTKNKTVRVFAGADKNAAGGAVQLISNLWLSTAAINSITVRDQSSLAWSATTTIALYGIKG